MKEELTVKELIFCGKCGKTVGRRMSDDSLHIMFGQKRNLTEERKEELIEKGGFILRRKKRFAMEVFVKGSAMIRCTSPYCDHTTIVL